MPFTRKLKVNRYGLTEDPRGMHVVYRYQGRDLLGEVTSVWRDDIRGYTHLEVRHFSREPWPIKPLARAVDVLVRTYQESGS